MQFVAAGIRSSPWPLPLGALALHQHALITREKADRRIDPAEEHRPGGGERRTPCTLGVAAFRERL